MEKAHERAHGGFLRPRVRLHTCTRPGACRHVFCSNHVGWCLPVEIFCRCGRRWLGPHRTQWISVSFASSTRNPGRFCLYSAPVGPRMQASPQVLTMISRNSPVRKCIQDTCADRLRAPAGKYGHFRSDHDEVITAMRSRPGDHGCSSSDSSCATHGRRRPPLAPTQLHLQHRHSFATSLLSALFLLIMQRSSAAESAASAAILRHAAAAGAVPPASASAAQGQGAAAHVGGQTTTWTGIRSVLPPIPSAAGCSDASSGRTEGQGQPAAAFPDRVRMVPTGIRSVPAPIPDAAGSAGAGPSAMETEQNGQGPGPAARAAAPADRPSPMFYSLPVLRVRRSPYSQNPGMSMESRVAQRPLTRVVDLSRVSRVHNWGLNPVADMNYSTFVLNPETVRPDMERFRNYQRKFGEHDAVQRWRE